MPAKIYYRNKQNYKPGLGGEHFTQPSQTVQGETLTLAEILVRYSQGMQVHRQRMEYFDEEDLENINRYFAPGALDLTDLDELNFHVQQLTNAVQKAQEKAEQAKGDNDVSPPPDEPLEANDDLSEED